MKKLIGYCRVSTERQKSARNGLEAQREEIENFARANGYELVEIVEESVSGKYGLDYRPVLKAAIQKANKMKATLIVSKLDRLSRSAAFIMNLMETKLNFVVAELGEDVTPLMLHIHCVISEAERRAIGARTKAALQAKKRREPEWKPGNEKSLEENRPKGIQTQVTMADIFAANMRPIIVGMTSTGMSLREVARVLNTQEVKTPRGGAWTAQSISNLRARWKDVLIYAS
jgi:DNA invertase Pin-like site-specific DNA recombinase